MEKEYILQTGNDLGREQIHCLETILDPHSVEVLKATQIKPGQTCLDVGSGGGSITRWLAGQVGPTGRVVSTDIESKHRVDQSSIDWRIHDINDGVPQGGPYDVIHTRLVLMHLSRREELLRSLADALKPGGWLVVGDFVGPPLRVVSAPSPEDEELFHRVQEITTGSIGAKGGIDYTWAHRIDSNMVKAGLHGVETMQYSHVDSGGSPGCMLHRNYNLQIAHVLPQFGFTDTEIKRYQEMMFDPQFRVWMYPFIVSRGQKVPS